METQTEKSCQNCYYFRQHYYKSNNGRLVRVACDGHCTNGNVAKVTSRKLILKCSVCGFWEEQAPLLAEQREGVCKAIFKMYKMLEDIAFILQDD